MGSTALTGRQFSHCTPEAVDGPGEVVCQRKRVNQNQWQQEQRRDQH